MVMVVPKGGLSPIQRMARVRVRKAHLAIAAPPPLPLPVTMVSLPEMGSTKYWLPTARSHWVQVLLLQVKLAPMPAQSVSAQQFPGTHLLAQQKSALLAAQAWPLLAQVLVRHSPLLAPAAVLHRLRVFL